MYIMSNQWMLGGSKKEINTDRLEAYKMRKFINPLNSIWFIASKGYDKRDILPSTIQTGVHPVIGWATFSQAGLKHHQRHPRTILFWSSCRTFYFATSMVALTAIQAAHSEVSPSLVKLSGWQSWSFSHIGTEKKTLEKGPKKGPVIFQTLNISKSWTRLNHIIKHWWRPGLQVCVDLRPASCSQVLLDWRLTDFERKGEDREDQKTGYLVEFKDELYRCNGMYKYVQYIIIYNMGSPAIIAMSYKWRFEGLATRDWPVSSTREPPWFLVRSMEDTLFWNKSKHWLRAWIKKNLLRFWQSMISYNTRRPSPVCQCESNRDWCSCQDIAGCKCVQNCKE